MQPVVGALDDAQEAAPGLLTRRAPKGRPAPVGVYPSTGEGGGLIKHLRKVCLVPISPPLPGEEHFEYEWQIRLEGFNRVGIITLDSRHMRVPENLCSLASTQCSETSAEGKEMLALEVGEERGGGRMVDKLFLIGGLTSPDWGLNCIQCLQNVFRSVLQKKSVLGVLMCKSLQGYHNFFSKHLIPSNMIF